MVQKKLMLSCDKSKDAYYLGLNRIFINLPYLKAKLFEFFDFDIKRLFEADKNDIAAFREKYENVSVPHNFFSEINNLNLDKILEETKALGAKYITFEDENYPESLKDIEDFPLVLFYKGSFSDINFNKAVSIVGSRRATESARQNVKRIVDGFCGSDITIVSGLASGIDSAAHNAAISNNLKTIAVIGSGFDFTYPAENKTLYKQIEEKGLIFTEYPNYLRPMPVNFPQRNRIVTGLSKGVVVAEAKMKSGAMVSARIALEQGKELMCIPGLITNPNCEGIYHLIKNGAGVVTKTEDILNILNWEFETVQNAKNRSMSLSLLEEKIYNNICEQEISFEGLKQKLDVGINELMIELTNMEIKGLVTQKNGLYYISGRNER